MTLTIDISLYPNREDYITPIDGFIARLHAYEGLTIRTFPTSTVVQGEFNLAMRAFQESMRACREQFGMGVFVAKFIPDYEALPEDPESWSYEPGSQSE